MTNNPLAQLYDLIPDAQDIIYQIGQNTPLEQLYLHGFEALNLYIKREDLGPIHAYKWRGAYNAVYHHHQKTGCKTIVAASAGNHAQGVALAAKHLKINAKIFMPLAAPIMKQEAVKRHGGEYVELILTGDDYNQAGEAAKAFVQETGHIYIHPFDDLYTMAGQAMIADEIIEQSPQPLDYAFLQIGGGGMAGAVAAWLKKHNPNIKIIGVEGTDQASMQASVMAGHPITLEQTDAFCDGTAVTRPGDITYEICNQVIDEFITVSNEEVCAAIQTLWKSKRLIPEPSGAMGIAGLIQYNQSHDLTDKNVLSIICGANMDFNKLPLVVQKSSTSANITQQRRRYYRIALPEKKGALLHILDAHFQDVNVCGFRYGKTHETQAWQTIAIECTESQFDLFEGNLTLAGIEHYNITHDTDVTYGLIHYDAHLFKHPVFMTVAFPERKGALRELLRVISPHASICYFNYNYSGETIGRALMGFEFKNENDIPAFYKAIENSVVTVKPLDHNVLKRIL